MRHVLWQSLLALASLVLAQEPQDLYDSAMRQISALPAKYAAQQPIYDHTNLHKGIYIPQYDLEAQDFVSAVSQPPVPSLVTAEILPKLRTAAEAGLGSAACALGDIYTFGNFSVPADYPQALGYYHAAVSAEPNGHAYFMLGLMYSTGMFGETPVDLQKSNLYYELAAKNGDLNAILVLAHKYSNGIGCSADCDVAQFYYATLARRAMTFLSDKNRNPDAERTSRDIFLADFNGGIYGKKISESASSVMSNIDELVSVRETLHDNYIDSTDSSVIDYYFDAVQNFYGGYFFVQNYTKSYLNALTCSYLMKEHTDGSHSMSDIDRFIYGKCQGLVGRMYLKGLGTERSLNSAHRWLQSAASTSPDKENLLDLALLHSLDPTSNGDFSPLCKEYLASAVGNDSVHALYFYAKHLIAPNDPFQTSYTEKTFSAMIKAAFKGHHEAAFYLVDAIESGFAASTGAVYTCAKTVSFLKSFVERSEQILLPHLAYAYEELRHGNYKNALLGYSIAAEQGLVNAQLSTSYLLYQQQPLFTRKRKTFCNERVTTALSYLESASAQGHVDSTILLGDLYSKGIPAANISTDYAKAFAYYGQAASAGSAHGCYKLGYMYEYGLGTANNTVDYYMAKRYYDLSVKYYQDHFMRRASGEPKANTYAVGIALLRLKLKALFSKSEKLDNNEDTGWLGTLKELAKAREEEDSESVADAKAQAHQEGTTYERDEPFQTFDYVVLFIFIAFFAYVSFQNIYAWMRGTGVNRNMNGGPANDPLRAQMNFGDGRFHLEAAFAI